MLYVITAHQILVLKRAAVKELLCLPKGKGRTGGAPSKPAILKKKPEKNNIRIPFEQNEDTTLDERCILAKFW